MLHHPLFFSWAYWDPSRKAFTIPYFNHPVAWYGLLFVFGFVLGYFIIHAIFMRYLTELGYPKTNKHSDLFKTRSEMAYFLADRLSWFVIVGTVIGARLGDVIFYTGPYLENPLDIFKVWEGGLASHGGVVGVLIALALYLKYIKRFIPELSYLRLLDFVSIPSALVACFIRIGNLMNQEILGKPSSLPWAIIFGHPADGSAPFPRHPVQLYEAIAYLIIFVILWFLWKKTDIIHYPGKLIGWMFILIFGSRFCLEFFKATQDSFLNTKYLEAGQILSIPFIALGVYFVSTAKYKNEQLTE